MSGRLSAGWVLGAVLFVCAGDLYAGNVEVVSIETTVSDLDQARRFYTQVLQFSPVSERDEAGRRTAALRLGDETLVLVDPKIDGRPIPANMPADDPRFQHIAIVVSDMDQAYRRLLAHQVEMVSAAPQTLPDWNFDAAGIRALYFRDPDGHFLELIQFPDNKGEPKWRWHDGRPGGRMFLGIDHSAIVVRDMQASRHFYRDVLGLTMIGTSLNYGEEQDHLNGLSGSRVKITGLRGAKGPGIELLQYLAPSTAQPAMDTPATDDLLHWQINLELPHAWDGESSTRDPDGHALSVSTREGDKTLFRSPFDLIGEALRLHWPHYLMEGALLGIFMIVTLYLTIALEHPGSPLRRRIASDLWRRALMGSGIGVTVIVLIYCDWGRLSGAHFNPAVTLAYLSIGRIEPWDAFFYIAAQFLGGWLGLFIVAFPVRRAASHGKVNYVVTKPASHAAPVAFVAEVFISFLILFSLLQVSQQPALKPWIGVIAGLHLWAFITFEAPFSGMSLNPARSLASAIPARDFKGLWIYFAAPPLAMLLAAQLCRRWIDS